MSTVDLSIIIVSWNVRELLKECLASIYKYTTDITFEVFVVDNASSDGSAEMVCESFPQVNLIRNKLNLGFAKANNQAIRISKGRYIALLNPDTLLIEDVFSSLVKYADHHEKIGAIGPKILCKDSKTIQNVCARRLPNLYFDFCRLSGLSARFPKIFGLEYMADWDHNNSCYVEGLSGACMLVNKKAIDDVGLMEENQFMYGDEIDWCTRLLKGGWKIYYYADVSIIHYGGESTKQSKLLMTMEDEKARMYYYKKNRGSLYAFLYGLLVLMFYLGKYIWRNAFRNQDTDVKDLTALYKNISNWAMKTLTKRVINN